MADAIRYTADMDRKLRDAVEWQIHHLYYNLHTKQDNVPFSMHELADALVKKGYLIDDEEEHVKPYFGYMCNVDYLTLVKLHNCDCCIKEYRDNDVRIFAGRGGDGDIYLRDTTLEQTVQIIEQIDAAIPDIIKKCSEKILHEEKKAKQEAINQKTVETVVKATLKDTGILYKLSFSSYKALLTLQLDNGLETNIYLSYKDFMAKIPFLVSTVEQLNGIMKNLGQPLRIKGTYYGEKDKWTESK